MTGGITTPPPPEGFEYHDPDEGGNGLYLPNPDFGHDAPVTRTPGGERIEAVFKKHVRQSKGRWRGKPLGIYPAQRGFLHELMRTEVGRRIYTEALLGIPRKNGKSTITAGLALYLLLFDGEPAPEVYGAAGSRDQAKIVFQEAARMVRQSPLLSEWCKVYAKEITVPAIDGVYRAVSADGGLQMGSNPSGVVADELHVWKGDRGRELYYALSTGMLARENPLFITITTAGYELDSIAYEVFERGLSGDEASFLMWWHGAREDEDPTDPRVWLRANPAPWITEEILRREFKRRPPSVFSRLHLNVWTTSEQLWLPQGAWRQLTDENIAIEPGERVWLGVDIGFKRDASAVVEVARRDGAGPGGKDLYIFKAYIFPPAVDEDGHLNLAPVKNKIADLIGKRRVQSLRYDRTLFAESAHELAELVKVEEFPWSSNQRVVEASEALYEIIVEGRGRHDGDAEFTKHVEAGAIRETESGFRVTKQKAKRRMDALAALLAAVSGAVERRVGAEPGARPIDLRPLARKKDSDDGVILEHPAVMRAVERVRGGGVVEVEEDVYARWVRDGLAAFAAKCTADGEDLYARIATAELRRLDRVHGYDTFT